MSEESAAAARFARLREDEEPTVIAVNDENGEDGTIQINYNVITVDFSTRSPLVLEELPLAAADDTAEEDFAGLSDFLLLEKERPRPRFSRLLRS